MADSLYNVLKQFNVPFYISEVEDGVYKATCHGEFWYGYSYDNVIKKVAVFIAIMFAGSALAERLHRVGGGDFNEEVKYQKGKL